MPSTRMCIASAKALLFQAFRAECKPKMGLRETGYTMVRSMPEYTFTRAAAIGSGMMGPGIALTAALGGIPSTILSRTREGAAQGLENARAQARLLAENGLLSDAEARAALERLDASDRFDETIAAADLVVESAPENLPFKQELFERMDRIAQPKAVLASNTSGLSITAIAERCAHPERVLTT